jgi:hypothetical protein
MQGKTPRRGAFKEKGRPKTKLSITAFMDFLGFSAAIRLADGEDEANKLLTRITGFVRNWRGALVDRYSWSGRRSWEVKIFTDNIVIGYPIQDHSNPDPEFGSVIGQLSLFQLGAVGEGFFVRGGIALGQLYMDEDVVFGIPLLDAYLAESKEAQSPRVIFSESAISSVIKGLGKKKHVHHSPYYKDLLQDEDGRFFLNYLEASFTASGEPPQYDWIEQHRDATTASLTRFQEMPDILNKYEWVARYHNFWCGISGLDGYEIPGILPLRARRLDEMENTGEA